MKGPTSLVVGVLTLTGCLGPAHVDVWVANLTAGDVAGVLSITGGGQTLLEEPFSLAQDESWQLVEGLRLDAGGYNVTVDVDGAVSYRNITITDDSQGITATILEDEIRISVSVT